MFDKLDFNKDIIKMLAFIGAMYIYLKLIIGTIKFFFGSNNESQA